MHSGSVHLNDPPAIFTLCWIFGINSQGDHLVNTRVNRFDNVRGSKSILYEAETLRITTQWSADPPDIFLWQFSTLYVEHVYSIVFWITRKAASNAIANAQGALRRSINFHLLAGVKQENLC